MSKLKLTQYEKNNLFYALQYEISGSIKELTRAVYDRTDSTVFHELDDIKNKLELLYKLDKEGWSDWLGGEE